MGDFLGFTFGGVHSSDLGITRVSSGDRYDEELHPEIKDRTAEVPGLNGQYYFGSDYGTKEFNIEFAFDSLTETQFRTLRKVFGTKDIQPLIFNERPYKKYLVKIESPIELSYVCFDERAKSEGIARDGVRVKNRTPITEEVDGEEIVAGYSIEREQVTPYVYSNTTERIYKGEGTINFICYFPFAKSVFKELSSADEGSDWAVSSGILSAANYAEFDKYNNQNGVIKIYNAGDLPTGFRLYCPFSAAASLKISYTPILNEGQTAHLNINTIEPQDNDIGFIINTDSGLIQGVKGFTILVPQIDENTGNPILDEHDEPVVVEKTVGVLFDEYGNANYTTSGNIYNSYIDSGYFFRLEPNILYTDGASIAITDINDEQIIIAEGAESIQIFYDYLYF